MIPAEVNTGRAILQKITDPITDNSGIELYIKREDLIHPWFNGNKWYKLKYNLTAARESGYDTLLSFGGAYSNHIYALAAAGKAFGFKTIGIIRGEEHLPLNCTLRFAKSCGMQIKYLPRNEYRYKKEEQVIKRLKDDYGSFYLLPEGGTNRLAVDGCREIIETIKTDFDYICVPCGTGGTIAGLIEATENKFRIAGFPVLKGGGFLSGEINNLLSNNSGRYNNWDLLTDYHFGGYAKYNAELLNFMEKFEKKHNILLDQVYTAKMMYGVYDLIRKNYFKKGAVIIAIHTGGIQGRLQNAVKEQKCLRE